MKKALERMQAMQNRLAQLQVASSINTNFGDFGQSIAMFVHGKDSITSVNWRSFDQERWGEDWEEFELKIKAEFLGWWE